VKEKKERKKTKVVVVLQVKEHLRFVCKVYVCEECVVTPVTGGEEVI